MWSHALRQDPFLPTLLWTVVDRCVVCEEFRFEIGFIVDLVLEAFTACASLFVLPHLQLGRPTHNHRTRSAVMRSIVAREVSYTLLKLHASEYLYYLADG